MEKKTVVLYPGLAVSHFGLMTHLAGALVEHGYAVSVALIDPSVKEDIALDVVVRCVAASMPSVRFHTLPAVEDLPQLTYDTQFLLGYFDLVRRYNERLHSFLRSSSTRIHAVVVDAVSNEAIGVVKRLGIPVYTMFPAGAATLTAIAQVPYVLAEARASSTEPLGEAPLELSVLESVTAGVPMLCWPLFAEQKMNKLLMVKDMRIAVEMAGWQDGLVEATEVEGKIRLVMESAEGRALRVRVAVHKERAGAACNDGGSSRLAFSQFLADMDNRQHQTSSGGAASDA